MQGDLLGGRELQTRGDAPGPVERARYVRLDPGGSGRLDGSPRRAHPAHWRELDRNDVARLGARGGFDVVCALHALVRGDPDAARTTNRSQVFQREAWLL